MGKYVYGDLDGIELCCLIDVAVFCVKNGIEFYVGYGLIFDNVVFIVVIL